MDSLFLLVISITALVVLIKWRLKKAEQRLLGIPFSLDSGSQHPEGTLYYFYHPRCGPCRSMMPIIDELREKYPGRIEKIHVGEKRDLILAMGIRATPTTLLVKNNKISKAIIGAKSVKTLETMLTPSSS